MTLHGVDRIAFWLIQHVLSRKKNQRFERHEFEEFAAAWQGRTANEFYAATEPAEATKRARDSLAALPIPGRSNWQCPSPWPSPHPENNHLWAEFHLARPLDQAPIFLVQHGWRSVSVRGYHGLCAKLNRMGVNAAVLHLPYHFSRRARGSFSGELAITSNMARSAYALRQAVREACWLRRLLKQLGAPAVGLWGTSYGAWVSAMSITQEEGFDGALLLEPPVEIEEIFWEVPLFSNLQKELRRMGITRDSIRDLFRLATPFEHTPRMDPTRVLILGSERDPISHPDSLRKLHQAWPGSYLEIFPYGHISYRLHTSAMERFLSILAPKLLTPPPPPS